MKIYYEACDNYKMFNSTTGEAIVNEVCDDNAKSLIGYWLDDFTHFNDMSLEQAWKIYKGKKIDKDDIYFNWDALTEFIKQYNAPEWIAYHIQVGYDSPVLFVVEKDVVVEELDEAE